MHEIHPGYQAKSPNGRQYIVNYSPLIELAPGCNNFGTDDDLQECSGAPPLILAFQLLNLWPNTYGIFIHRPWHKDPPVLPRLLVMSQETLDKDG